MPILSAINSWEALGYFGMYLLVIATVLGVLIWIVRTASGRKKIEKRLSALEEEVAQLKRKEQKH